MSRNQVSVTNKMSRSRGRCDNHPHKKAVVRISQNERNLISGDHLCIDCVEAIVEYYNDNLKETRETINEKVDKAIDNVKETASNMVDKAKETVTNIFSGKDKEEETDEIDKMIEDATSGNGAPQLKEETKAITITKEMIMNANSADELKEIATQMGVNLRSMRKPESMKKVLVEKLAEV